MKTEAMALRARRKKSRGEQVNETAYIHMIGAYTLMMAAYDSLKEEIKEVKAIANTW